MLTYRLSMLKEGPERDGDPIGLRDDGAPDKDVVIRLFDLIQDAHAALPRKAQFPAQTARDVRGKQTPLRKELARTLDFERQQIPEILRLTRRFAAPSPFGRG